MSAVIDTAKFERRYRGKPSNCQVGSWIFTRTDTGKVEEFHAESYARAAGRLRDGHWELMT